MDENLNVNTTEVGAENTAQNYIDAIQDLQNKLKNTVSLDTYNKVLDENRTLVNAYANGFSMSTDNETKKVRSSEEICKLMNDKKKHHSATDYMELALEYRDAVLNETGEDVFVSKGHRISPTPEGYASAENFTNATRYCLDYADGDNQLFAQEMQRIMIENPAANLINKNNNNRKR